MSRFQCFDEPNDRERSAQRIAALRVELARLGLDGFVVPRADRHQGEYVPPCDERLAFLTGFSGSAGTAVVLKDEAAIFVDGRYTLAVREQVDAAVVTPVPVAETAPEAWLRQRLNSGDRLGYDPWLLTPDQVKRLAKAADAVGATLVSMGPSSCNSLTTTCGTTSLRCMMSGVRSLRWLSASLATCSSLNASPVVCSCV